MIDEIVSRISTACPVFGGRVEGPTQVGALERTYPLAVVYPTKGDPGESFGSSMTVSRTYGIEITAESDAIESALSSCLIALHGYKPEDAISSLRYRGDKTQAVDGALIKILMSFSVTVCGA